MSIWFSVVLPLFISLNLLFDVQKCVEKSKGHRLVATKRIFSFFMWYYFRVVVMTIFYCNKTFCLKTILFIVLSGLEKCQKDASPFYTSFDF